MNVGFIGAGTVGTALALTLSKRGYRVTAVASRTTASAQRLASQIEGCQVAPTPQSAADSSDLVFITTPDAAIGPTAAALLWRPGQMAVHCSGADSVDILEPVRAQGALAGAFHPLQSFANPSQAIENLPGSFFALEGEGVLLALLKEMAEALGGKFAVLQPGDKVLYHAAAVFVSNYTVALMAIATELWQAFGVPQDQASAALLPLLQGTVNNIGRVGLPNCLTGPIARGDTGTIRKHLNALATSAPRLLPAYREMGLRAVPVSLSKGKISAGQAAEMEALLAGRAA